MRRTIFLALLAALLFAPAARAQGLTTIEKIQRDCQDDDQLEGNYTLSQLREARGTLPTDNDEYSACRDVISRAIAAKASKTPTPTPSPGSTDNGGGSSNGGGTGSGSGSGGDNGAGSTPMPESTPTPSAQQQQDAAVLAAPSSPQDKQAVDAALADGERQIKKQLVARSPDQDRLAASVGRNGLPTTMIAVLVLIVAAVAATLLPLLRRRRDLPGHPST